MEASVPPRARVAQSAAAAEKLRLTGKAAKQKLELLGATQPAGQVQVVAPLRAKNVPAGHGEQDAAPEVGEKEPGEHSEQVALDDAPVELLLVPAGQRLQDAAPGNEYDPGEQGRQLVLEEAPAVGLYEPAAQAVALMELKGQKKPAWQRMGAPEKQ
jgi:hypothetical protein